MVIDYAKQGTGFSCAANTHSAITATRGQKVLNCKGETKLNTETEPTRQTDGNNTAGRVMTRRIGNTTYKVNVHFSRTSRETVNDKIIRMIKNETAGKSAGT